MSQNTRNQPSDSQGNSGRGYNETQRRKSYEGFEGMNYEQKRRPYNETDRLYKDWDRNVENNSKSGRRHDNR